MTARAVSMRRAMEPFHVMAKPVGAACNLDCAYCFYLSKQLLYPGARLRMDAALLERYIRQLFEGHGPGDVIVAWQGGEPTLAGIGFFEQAAALVEKYRRADQRSLHCLQTNAVLIDRTWARFFKDHGFLVGVSVDGPPALHDAFRVDKQGGRTFDRVARGVAALRGAGVEWNVLTTVHHANAAFARQIYRFLRDRLGARHLQFIPIVERESSASRARATDAGATRRRAASEPRPFYSQQGDHAGARSVSAAAYGRFLIDVFDEWVARDVGRVSVQAFDAALAAWLGLPSPVCVHAERCPAAVALEHNGDLYSCDHYVEPAYRLGNIGETAMRALVDSEAQAVFRNAKADALPAECRSCEFLFACNGGCPKDRFEPTLDGARGRNHLCDGYQAFFRHIDPVMKAMAQRIRAGHPIANRAKGARPQSPARFQR